MNQINYKTKPCERCWTTIKNIWWSKYCLECRKVRDDELAKQSHLKRKLESKKKRVE